MSTILKLRDRLSLLIPMFSLVAVCLVQWLLIPNTGFYLVFDKMILFYWLIYRPDRISIFWVCILYLIPDIKEGWALGFSSLTTLFFIWIVLLQRHVLMRQNFLFQWVALGLLVCMYFLFLQVTYSYMASHRLDVMPLMISALLGLLLFPLGVRFMAIMQKYVPMFADLED